MTTFRNKKTSLDVHLTPWCDEDAAGMFKALSDDRIYAYIREIPARTALELAIRYEHRPDPIGRSILNFTARVEDEIIGLAQAVVNPNLGITNVGYKISPKFWRMGVGGELLSRLLSTVLMDHRNTIFQAEVDSRNIASIKVLKNNEFVEIAANPSTLKFQESTDLIFERKPLHAHKQAR